MSEVAGVRETVRVEAEVVDACFALALVEYPLEACGLLAGPVGDLRVTRMYPCRNTEASARIYTVDPRDHLRAEIDAEERGLEIRGVVHSHTHTEAYPSPTDVAAAPDPGWHYWIVTLKREVPEIRGFRIVDGVISETFLDQVQPFWP